MVKKILFVVLVIIVLGLIFKTYMNNNKENETSIPSAQDAVTVDPISHASMVLNWDGSAIYTDPVGDAKMFEGKPVPNIILLTDIHEDHLDLERLKALATQNTVIVAPSAVQAKLPELPATVRVMNNGEKKDVSGFTIEAIPMYNLPGPSESFHTKGRGNGYVIEKNGTRVYVSGDTAGIPEMRDLKDIDMAFICMNLPYTMGVDEAASAVLDFKPKKVYPYHYRNQDGSLSDIAEFKELVNSKDANIKVVELNWYPKQ